MTDVPSRMRAAVLTGHGGPEMLVVRDDVPVPAVGPGEALIRVSACGVNNTDINTRVGWYNKSVTGSTSEAAATGTDAVDGTWGSGRLSFPRIQGADPCGTVVAVADAGDDGLVGRRVMVDPWVRDPDQPLDRTRAGYIGSESDGGFAEFCAVPTRNAHPVAGELSDVEVAGLACSWSTAYHMLHRVRLGSGERIAVPGASGGVGSALVSLAALRGAQVTAVAGRNKLEQVGELGAHHLVARDEDEVPGSALAAAGGPFDVVADVVGGADFGRWLDVLARGGRYVTSGAIAGPLVELDLRTLYLNDLELHGATVFGPDLFGELVALVEAGEIRPPIAATFPLERIHEAQAAFEAKTHVGKIVVTL